MIAIMCMVLLVISGGRSHSVQYLNHACLLCLLACLYIVYAVAAAYAAAAAAILTRLKDTRCVPG